jgi:hypothetical protein
MNQPQGYPSNFDQFREHEVYGHGGVRIYSISPQQAAAIHKELKMTYDLQELREGHEYFYLNQNHGEHHASGAISASESPWLAT